MRKLNSPSRFGVFPIITFSYAEAPFDLGVVSPFSLYIFRNTHREISSEFFGPWTVTLANSHGKGRLTRYRRLYISLEKVIMGNTPKLFGLTGVAVSDYV